MGSLEFPRWKQRARKSPLLINCDTTCSVVSLADSVFLRSTSWPEVSRAIQWEPNNPHRRQIPFSATFALLRPDSGRHIDHLPAAPILILTSMSVPFVHLHCHTDYSLLDGACEITQLMKLAARQEMPAIAITDHGTSSEPFSSTTRVRPAGSSRSSAARSTSPRKGIRLAASPIAITI